MHPISYIHARRRIAVSYSVIILNNYLINKINVLKIPGSTDVPTEFVARLRIADRLHSRGDGVGGEGKVSYGRGTVGFID